MCIIVVKKKNQPLPSMDTLRECWNNNPDGAGFSYTYADKVLIDKGYMSFKSFKKRYRKLLHQFNNFENKALVIHFRIGTALANTPENTHPFPLSDKTADLRKLKTRADLSIAHNGIISEYNPGQENTNLDLTDTGNFIKHFLTPIYKGDSDCFNKQPMLALIKKTADSKLAILQANDNIITLGDFYEYKGNLYSNQTYKTYTPIYHHYPNYNYKPITTNVKSEPAIISYCDYCGDSFYQEDIEYNREYNSFLCEDCRKLLKQADLL